LERYSTVLLLELWMELVKELKLAALLCQLHHHSYRSVLKLKGFLLAP
jgi:hypothetical protein